MVPSLLIAVFLSARPAAPSECVLRDAVRIQSHLLRTEAALRAAPLSGLSDSQRVARGRNLDRLHAYALAGEFPINDRFAERTPFFIDRNGTRCAMAALIEQAGGAEFVQRISRERNNARIYELTNEPELISWLDQNGLTVDEAARIQPTYEFDRCAPIRTRMFCEGDGRGAAVVRITGADDGGLYAVAEESFGDGGVVLGAQYNVDPQNVFLRFRDRTPVGGQAFAVTGGPGRLFVAGEVIDDGGISNFEDRRCVPRVSASREQVARMFPLDTSFDCESAVLPFAPQLGELLCPDFHHFSVSWPEDFCLDDGSPDPYMRLDAGRRPVNHASTVDAGFANGELGPRAGGCSVTSGSAFALLTVAAGAIARRRRRMG